MTFAIALQTGTGRYVLALSIPTYKPSSLLFLIFALFLAITGMGIDLALGLIVGTVAIYATIIALGLTLALLEREVRRYG